MKQKSIKKNFYYSAIQKFFSLLMPVVTFPYASRILLPDGIGKVNFSHSIVSYFAMIGALGITTYGIRDGAKVRNNKYDFTKFAKEVFSINLISTIVAYILLFLSLIFIKKLHPYTVIVLICSISLFLSVISVNWVFHAQEEFKYISLRSISFQLISLVYLFVFVKTKDDIIHYAIFGILSGSGSDILNFIYSRKFIDWKQNCKLEFRKHLKPILTLFGLTAAQTVYLVLDSSILGFISGDTAVGYYTAASKINKMVVGILGVINTTILPRLSYNAEHDISEYKKLLIKSFDITTLFTFPIVVGFCILSKDLLLLFCGSEYLPAINCMYILNLLLIVITLSSFLSSSILAPFRKDKYSLYGALLGATSNFTLNLILIPKYSYIGAAIATIVAETLVSISLLFFSIKTIGFIRGLFKNIYQYILGSLLMGFVVYYVHIYFNNSILSVILETVTGITIYFFVLIFFKNIFILDILKIIAGKFKSKQENNNE